MRKSNERFDAVFEAFVEYIVVKLQAGFIRLFFKTRRKDAGPVDGKAVCFESHFGKQGDIFLVAMETVYGLMAWIIVLFKNAEHGIFRRVEGEHFIRVDLSVSCSVGYVTGFFARTSRYDIGCRRAFAVDVPSAFILIGSDGAAP